ncbi:MAG: hypothetical protein WC332_08530 [Clostridia bacterium]
MIELLIKKRGFEIRKSFTGYDIINPDEIDINCGIVSSGRTLKEAYAKICPHDFTDHGDFLRSCEYLKHTWKELFQVLYPLP